MTKITQFGSHEHRLVSSKVLAALATLETELGVKFESQGGQHGLGGGFLRIGVVLSSMANGKSGPQTAYERIAYLHGMKNEWFGVPFWSQGVEYRICGANLGSPKYRLMIERMRDGKQFKGTVDMCKRGLEAAVAAGRIAA